MKFSPKWTRKTYIPWSSPQNELSTHQCTVKDGWMDGWMNAKWSRNSFLLGLSFSG
jgi:hypothetical protein